MEGSRESASTAASASRKFVSVGVSIRPNVSTARARASASGQASVDREAPVVQRGGRARAQSAGMRAGVAASRTRRERAWGGCCEVLDGVEVGERAAAQPCVGDGGSLTSGIAARE